MQENSPTQKTCLIIGASHAGVSCAFSLRKEGWRGEIILFDPDPFLPYHRPPLSKDYLLGAANQDKNVLRGVNSYEKENISLSLGKKVVAIHRGEKTIVLSDGSQHAYDKLVIATGARPLLPKIPGLDTVGQVFTLRNAQDAQQIYQALQSTKEKRVAIIGAGYIGLEAAASLNKLGADVTILEREERVLKRVTSPELSEFYQQLHADHGVNILLNKQVHAVEKHENHRELLCADQSRVKADIIIVACGILPNIELAEQAGIEIENGIRVDASACTNDKNIYAVGDCTFHFNPHYARFIRLESVQNAADQAKVAASAMNGKASIYDAIPWFWSDQYDLKLQMVGLSSGYNHTVLRKEATEETSFSLWYFKDETLLAVDAVNNGKAYVLGTRFIKNNQKLDKANLGDSSIPFKPANLVAE